MAIMMTGYISFANTNEANLKSNEIKKLDQYDPCTVSMKGNVNIGYAGFEITCTVTSNTCKSAAKQAIECVSTTIKEIKNHLV